jgi:HNH endonuclease
MLAKATVASSSLLYALSDWGGPAPSPGSATRISMMARARADIANTAVRIFLQEMGKLHDEERGLHPYRKSDFQVVRDFFGDRCCYCDTAFDERTAAHQDHLIPINRTNLGLDAWGNVVPACRECNNQKQGADWRAFIIRRAGEHAAERHERVVAFLKKYRYKPDLNQIRNVAEALSEESAALGITLIESKIKRLRENKT